jgi:hypothetical protein
MNNIFCFEVQCLGCGRNMNAHSEVTPNPNPAPPSEGNIAICFKCGAAMIFDEDLKLRWPTEQEKIEFKNDNTEKAIEWVRSQRTVQH